MASIPKHIELFIFVKEDYSEIKNAINRIKECCEMQVAKGTYDYYTGEIERCVNIINYILEDKNDQT